MHTIKLISLFIAFILFQVTNTFGQIPTKLSLKISVSTIDSISYSFCDPINNLEIKIKIRNDSIETASFWLWSCSKSMNFCTNDSNIKICTEVCFSNYPYVKKLKKNEEFIFSLYIPHANFTKLNNFKIGFIYVGENISDQDYSTVVSKIEEKHDIIWSNEISK